MGVCLIIGAISALAPTWANFLFTLSFVRAKAGTFSNMPAMVSKETKPIIPESVLKKRRTKEAIAAKQAAKQEADQKVC